ncbi:hypothetical protein PsorP6_001020 [Peronosclerospora sorghi]|uniref:Uncharacterized protein n=1 Tax=Peronosclerospora sorghi TaxID=230839 RepID=A0ACC0WTY3_9STRA|nr:hypothetical protein PsorP6_001020 [Peronosclerospora sorghi]
MEPYCTYTECHRSSFNHGNKIQHFKLCMVSRYSLHSASSCSRRALDHPCSSPIICTTRCTNCLVALVSMNARRIRRPRISVAFWAYSCRTANTTSASKYGYLGCNRRG